ncbi:MAG: hypothetical protein ABSC51_01555 [Gaiellaceae bacterium]|jgi:hypothetical protein
MRTTLPKRKATPLNPESLRIVAVQVSELLDGVSLKTSAIEKLDPGVQHELAALCMKGVAEHIPRHTEQALREQTAAERKAAEEFAARLEAAEPGDALGALQPVAKHNYGLAAELARSQKRPPSREQFDAITRNRDTNATLADLTVSTFEPPAVAKVRIPLSEKDERRLEQLVGLALAGDENYFEKKREKAANMRTIKEMATELAQVPPRRFRRYEAPGTVALPAELIAQVTCEPPGLWIGDLGVLALIISSLELRKVPPESGWRLEEDDTVLVTRPAAFWQEFDDRDNPSVNINRAVEHLTANHWIEIRGRDNQSLRIAKGSRLVKFDKKRGGS